MTSLFAFLASIIEMIASAGAGVASIGFGYQADMEEIRERMEQIWQLQRRILLSQR